MFGHYLTLSLTNHKDIEMVRLNPVKYLKQRATEECTINVSKF